LLDCLNDVDMTDLKKRNLRTGLILAAIAVMFMLSVIVKRVWFS
jgi:hypothetical protein